MTKMLVWVAALAFLAAKPALADGAAVIRLSSGGTQWTVTLEDHGACRDFLSLLPLELDFEDYNGTERIAYLPRKLDTSGSPGSCDPEAGTVAYYGPWGNLAVFYRDFRHSQGLVPLGRVSGGERPLMEIGGKVRIERVQ